MRRSALWAAIARQRIVGLIYVSLLMTLAGRASAESPADREAKKLHGLLDAEWQWTLLEYPEFATSVGEPRYNDKLTDFSAAAMDRRKAHERDVLQRIRNIDRGLLTGQDVLSYDLFRRSAEQSVALQRFPTGTITSQGYLIPFEWMPVCQMSGVHINIPELTRLAPLRSTKDYDDFLARLAAYPRQVDQIVELMKRGMASGWMPAAVPMRAVLPQIEKQWVDDVTKSPLYKPFQGFPDGTTAGERSRLAAQGAEAISGSIIPALKSLHQFIAGTYLPACRQEIAAIGLPGGPAFYEAQIRWWTTTDLSASKIHDVGSLEVAQDPQSHARSDSTDGIFRNAPRVREIPEDRLALRSRTSRRGPAGVP